MFAGPLSELNPKQKAVGLNTWIGAHGREVYKTFTWEETEKDDPYKVLNRFETYVRPRKNKRIAQHQLKQRKQKSEETFDNFVKDLRIILMVCEYADPEDILIDAIIDGIFESRVQERLLAQGEGLSLAKALEMGQQFELSRKQIRIVRNEDNYKPGVSAISSEQIASQALCFVIIAASI